MSPRSSGDPKKRVDWQSSFREASPYMGLGIQLALVMVFFTVGGYLIDRTAGTLPWLTVLGGVLGMVAIFTKLIRVSSELSADARKRRESRGPKTDGSAD